MLALKYENFVRQYAWLVQRTYEVVAARLARLGYGQCSVRGVIFHEDGATASYTAVNARGLEICGEFDVESHEWFMVNEEANDDSPIADSDLYEFNAFQLFLRLTAEGIVAKRLDALTDGTAKWAADSFDFDNSGCRVRYHTFCDDGCDSPDGESEVALTDLLSPLND